MYLQQEMYLIKNYSVDIHIATVICGISFLLIDSKYSGKLCILMTIDGSYSDSRITQSTTFHVVREISSDDKEFDILRYHRKRIRSRRQLGILRCLSTRVLSFSNDFLARKPYFKRMKFSTDRNRFVQKLLIIKIQQEGSRND